MPMKEEIKPFLISFFIEPTVCPTDVQGSADVPYTIVISWKVTYFVLNI
jgi:hypothetical protein